MTEKMFTGTLNHNKNIKQNKTRKETKRKNRQVFPIVQQSCNVKILHKKITMTESEKHDKHVRMVITSFSLLIVNDYS